MDECSGATASGEVETVLARLSRLALTCTVAGRRRRVLTTGDATTAAVGRERTRLGGTLRARVLPALR